MPSQACEVCYVTFITKLMRAFARVREFLHQLESKLPKPSPGTLLQLPDVCELPRTPTSRLHSGEGDANAL
jgi:hypothetical protein